MQRVIVVPFCGVEGRTKTVLAAVAIVLATATPCHAHALHPIAFGLGPVSLFIAAGSVLGWAALSAIICLQAIVLHRFIPAEGFLGSLWRAGFVLVSARVAELVPALINPDVFMGVCSDAMLTLIGALMFVVGAGVSAALIRLLYWRSRPNTRRILGVSWALQAISVGGLYLCNTALIAAGLVR